MSNDAKREDSTAPVRVTRDGRLIKSSLEIIKSGPAMRDYETLKRLQREGKLPLQKKK